MAKKINEHGFEEFEKGHGKKPNQKLKPYLVLQYLLRQSDENHVVSAENIVGYLEETCGIYVERCSIYRDIEEINKAMLIVEEEIGVHEAERRIVEDESEKLVINDGNYYLLAFDDYAQDMRTYRVDRMKGCKPHRRAKRGRRSLFRNRLENIFSMFGGKQERVTIHFINPLLDAVVDRFGNDKNSVQYAKVDGTPFSATTHVEMSDQFFGWVLGFGRKAKLVGFEAAVKQFWAYLD